jgi:hypothetical protein
MTNSNDEKSVWHRNVDRLLVFATAGLILWVLAVQISDLFVR